MIAKEIIKKGSSSFGRLINYITREQSLKPNIHNCYGLESVEATIKLIQATQDLARGSGDKTYHLILSFHQEDKIKDKIHEIEKTVCEALGFGEHQRMSVLHEDTEHPHLHIAISRVHPETLRQHTPYYSFKKLARVCQQLEAQYQLRRDNHEFKNTIGSRVRDMERKSGKTSFKRFLKEEVHINLNKIHSWQDLCQAIHHFGLSLKQKNGSLKLICSDQSSFHQENIPELSLSTLGKNFHSATLLQQWGAPEHAALQPLQKEKSRKSYQPSKHALWEKFQAERAQILTARQQRSSALLQQQKEETADFIRKYKALRHEIQRSKTLSPQQKRKLYQQLAATRQTEFIKKKAHFQKQKQSIKEEHKLHTWKEFKALHGSEPSQGSLISQPTETLQAWISSRNALLGKVQNLQEHRFLTKALGSFQYRGVRHIEHQTVALLEKENITWVMPVSKRQEALLKGQKLGKTIELNGQAYFKIHRKSHHL